MKPKNFPARKEARRVAALSRQVCGNHETARNILESGSSGAVNICRQIRTKKRRAG